MTNATATRSGRGSRPGRRGPRATPDLMAGLRFIETYMQESGGVSPSQTEIAKAFGMTSRGGVTFTALKRLEDKGFIRQLPGLKRAIEIVRTAPNRIPIYDADTLQLRGHLP